MSSCDVGPGGRTRWGLVTLLLAVACTQPNAPDPTSPLGGWSYRFVASTTVAGQEVTCYEYGSVRFVRGDNNSISGYSGVVSSKCLPLGILTPREGRVPVEDAAVSQTSVRYRAEACVFTASTPLPSDGGPPTRGDGVVTCRNAVIGTADSATVAGALVLSR